MSLQRFVAAQDRGGSYDTALSELRAGRKRTHWIWWVFPQLPLGSSSNAVTYALSGVAEARDYLAHPELGPRLLACVDVLLALPASDPVQVMGSTIDAAKLRSSMTLFARAAPEEPRFDLVLEQYFGGERDPASL